jgi:tetratricopeptide (TPR) repeat protein
MRALRDAGGDAFESELLGSFIVIATGYLAQGVFSIDVAALAITGWLAFAGIAALADPALVAARQRLAFGEDETRTRRVGWARRGMVVVASIIVAVLMVAGLRPWLADRAAKQAQRDADATASTDIVMTSYQRAMALVPYDPVYRGLAANFLTSQAQQIDDKNVQTDLLSEAVELEKQMDTMQPGNAFWKTTIASGLSALGSVSGDESDYEEAEAWFSDAYAIAPNDYRVSLQHGLMLNRWGRATHDGLKYCEAISQLNTSNRLRKQTDVAIGLGEAYAAIGHVDDALAALNAGRELDPKNKDIPDLIKRVDALRTRKVKVINCT